MKALASPLLLVLCLAAVQLARLPQAFANEARITALIQAMTLEEKVSLLGGTGFATKPIARLGIPALEMTDGPLGVRSDEKTTAFPSGLSMAASFDPKLVQQTAAAIADEARASGKRMLLGPCVGISRHPFGGRNFEGMGEDPYLTSVIAPAYVRGIQSQNVLASVKHFAVNDQETQRAFVDTVVDMRSLFEFHLPAFKAAVDAGSWTVMAAYNKINGFWATENDFLLNRVLKEMWGFKGFVVSDWEATHHTLAAATNGLDIEMPFGTYFNASLVQLVREGKIRESVLDDKIRRLLRAMFAIGLIDGSSAPQLPPAEGPSSPRHREVALKLAQESLVLLKNEASLLPLDPARTKSIAVLGPNAAFARTGGAGSSEVYAYAPTSPLQGLTDRLKNSAVQIRYAPGIFMPGDSEPIQLERLKPTLEGTSHGLRAEFFANLDLKGEPFLTRLDEGVRFSTDAETDPRLKIPQFSVRWSGYIQAPRTGDYLFSSWSDDGIRVFIDDKDVLDDWESHSKAYDRGTVQLTSGWHKIRVEYYQDGGLGLAQLGWEPPGMQRLQTAIAYAKSSDVAIIFAGLGNGMESEDRDRDSMDLPDGEVELIKAVARANPNTVVVLNSGNPLQMQDWLSDVRSVVQAWYPGQEGGYAVADLLLGRINPSGRLPVTFLKRWEDSPAYGNFPGVNGSVVYAEGIFVGYRHFDVKHIEPNFPFGHGLSYTHFAYRNLHVAAISARHQAPKVRVEFDLTNDGTRDGAEVAQVYVGELHPLVPRPPRELKAFTKIYLREGETRHISLDLAEDAFHYFDVNSMSFRVNAGAYRIDVGASSRDLRFGQDTSLN